MRRLTIIIAVLMGSGFAAAQEVNSEYTYLIDRLDYSPYSRAILKLQIAGGRVQGQLEPLLGDLTTPTTVVGSNESEGSLKLTFRFGSPQEIKFEKFVTSDRIEWRQKDKQEDAVTFFRPRTGTFSETALTVVQENCGSQYRKIDAAFATSATDQLLTTFLNSTSNIAGIPVTAYRKPDGKKLSLTLGDTLKGILHSRIFVSFDVPVGLEAFVVRAMRPNRVLFKYANLSRGECGGAETSYVVIPKALLFSGGVLSRQLFEDYIDSRIRDFPNADKSGHTWPNRLEGKQVRVVDLPKPTINFSIRVYAASEITRQVPGYWDNFKVNFQPAETEETTTTDYAIVVEVERLKSVRRSAGSDSPPDSTYFRTELNEDDEAEVTTAITSYIAKHDSGWCFFDNEGYDAGSHHSRCAHSYVNR